MPAATAHPIPAMYRTEMYSVYIPVLVTRVLALAAINVTLTSVHFDVLWHAGDIVFHVSHRTSAAV